MDDLDNYVVGRKHVIAFYERLNQIDVRAQHIYVVQDKWSIHQHSDVVTALAKLSRLEPVWLPTYAPSLEPD